MAQPRVAVIVLTWNGLHDLITCLDSFEVVEYENYQVIVVDNASEDDTVQVVRERYPWVTLLVNEDNLGYVGGNNVGIRHALREDFEYVFILNNDTKMTPRVLPELVSVMQSDPSIAIAGAKNLLMENPAYTWGKYGKLTWGPMLVKTVGRFEIDSPEAAPKDVEWVIGNACMMRREALKKIGLFDDEFFQANEDVDWCIRARKLGYRVVYVDSAAILHRGGASAGVLRKVSFSYGYMLGRNAILFARRHANALQWTKLVAAMVLGLILRAMFYSAASFLGAYRTELPMLRGMLDAWQGRYQPAAAPVEPAPAVWKPLGSGRLVRFLRWIGA